MGQDKFHFIWSLGVFLVATTFYLLTSAWVAYPGESAGFVYLSLFLDSLWMGTSPLDALCAGSLVRCVPDAVAVQALSVGAACLGGLTVCALFWAALAAVRCSSMDVSGLRPQELARVRKDFSLVGGMTAVGVALAGMVVLPLWAVGTRPQPGAVSTFLGMVMIALALELKGRAMEVLARRQPFSRRFQLGMGGLAALGIYLGLGAVQLLPVVLFAFVVGGWALVQRRTERRGRLFVWMVAGGVVGFLLLWGTVAAQSLQPEGARLSLACREVTTWIFLVFASSCLKLLSSFAEIAALVAFALPAALFLGCFPRAFIRAGSPAIGQLGMVALLGLCFARWPAAFWERVAEPTPLVALGLAMMVLVAGLFVGSWWAAWLEGHGRWPMAKAHGVAAAGILCTLGALAMGECLAWRTEGAGCAARPLCQAVWRLEDQAFTRPATVWMDVPKEDVAAEYMVWRYAQGRPLYPMWGLATNWKKLVLNGKPWEACVQEDALLGRLMVGQLEAAALNYLRSSPVWQEALFAGPLPVGDERLFCENLDKLSGLPFAKTPVGQRYLKRLRAQAARLAVQRAYAQPPSEAAEGLRFALTQDADNRGAVLGLGALAAEGAEISEEEARAATLIVERTPALAEPPLALFEQFEQRYGPVRTPGFRAAARLKKLMRVDRDRMVQAYCTAYRQGDAQLSVQERIVALLLLPEAEVAELLAQGSPTAEEVAVYLFAYPLSERSKALFEQYQALLKENAGLQQLYKPRYGMVRENLRENLPERILSFFTRDGGFGEALFYVDACLRQGDVKAALAFVSGFSAQERLADRPYLLEFLRAKVLACLTAKADARSLEEVEMWLMNDPYQPALWNACLDLSAQEGPEVLEKAVRRCLGYYPTHPVAVEYFAETLQSDLGEAVAQAWTTAATRARANAMK